MHHESARRTCPLLLMAALMFALPWLASCENKPSDKSLVFVTIPEGERLVAGERNLLGKTKSAAWVDARTKADYDAGHIPGAISLPFEEVTANYYIVKDYSVVIVYAADYNDIRGNGMSKRLMELLEGHDIRTLDGGIRAWTAAGNALEPPQAEGNSATKPKPAGG